MVLVIKTSALDNKTTNEIWFMNALDELIEMFRVFDVTVSYLHLR